MSSKLTKRKSHHNSRESMQISSELQDSSIEKHDRFNFEVKLAYPLKKSNEKNHYDIEAYFFIPGALQINSLTYSHSEFFADINNYIRFKTPQMALSGILNPDNQLSPLNKVNYELNKVKNGQLSEKVFRHLKYELRVLGCIIKSTLRDQIEYYIEHLDKFQQTSEYKKNFKIFLTHIEKLHEDMQELDQESSLVQLSAEVRKYFIYVEKYIDLQIFERLTEILEIFVHKYGKEHEIIDDINQIIQKIEEKSSEIDKFFEIDEDDGQTNEKFSYFEGLLKKFVQKVLYLERKPADEKSRFLPFFYSFAAGLAMIISLGLGYFFDDHFAQNSSLYIALLIFAYMIKDRVKDWIKKASNQLVEKYFPDHRFEIWDIYHEQTIGTSKETMRFLKWNQIPIEIINIHQASAKSILELEGPKEDVFKFSKEIELFTDDILEYHKRHGDINDIMRFNIRHFLQYADDPQEDILKWVTTSKEMKKIHAAQVYHINVIFKIQAYSKKQKETEIYYKRLRVVIDQEGIKRVEEKKVKSL